MPFELRIDGRTVGTWATEEEAEGAARDAVRQAPDCEPEIIDTVTGRPATPAGSRALRDDLANKIGY